MRTGKSGKPFTTARLIVDTGEELAIFARVIAFGQEGERLAGLKQGDAVSVAGRATLGVYQSKTGETRVSLSVTADEVASMRRKPSERLGPSVDLYYAQAPLAGQ